MPKRKREDIIEQLHGTREEVKLKLHVPHVLACEICGKSVSSYREMKNVTCSYDCRSLLYISSLNRMLHEEDRKSFHEENNKMKED